MSDFAVLMESVAADPLVDHPADFHVFDQFLKRCKDLPPITTSVCWPLSEVALRGTVEAAVAGIIDPTLVGPECIGCQGAREEDCRGHFVLSGCGSSNGRKSCANQRGHVPGGSGASNDERQPAHR